MMYREDAAKLRCTKPGCSCKGPVKYILCSDCRGRCAAKIDTERGVVIFFCRDCQVEVEEVRIASAAEALN